MQFIDLHCDTISKLLRQGETSALRKNSLCVDVEKLIQGESLAQFFALFVDQRETKDCFAYAQCLLQRFQQEIAANEVSMHFAGNAADLERNRAAGKISAFLTIEEGGVLQGSMENLRAFYQSGVRLMTLTWNYPNELGWPNHDYTYQDRGLTPFGKACVEEMNALGMLIDVSHLSDQGFYDVAALSKKPFVASHSNSRSAKAHCRNLTDDMLRVLTEKGGVTGINFAAYFLGDGDFSRIDDMIRHIRHIYQIGGIEVLAIGSDFDGINPHLEIADFGQMQKLIAALQKSGFTETEIEKIAWKNALRVLADGMK